MSKFAISLLGENGQIHSFAVPATVLVQHYQALMESELTPNLILIRSLSPNGVMQFLTNIPILMF